MGNMQDTLAHGMDDLQYQDETEQNEFRQADDNDDEKTLRSPKRQKNNRHTTLGATGPVHTPRRPGLRPRQQTTTKDALQSILSHPSVWRSIPKLSDTSRHAGVIPHLEAHFDSGRSKHTTVSAYLCSPDTDHISTEINDLGWGCGYRNCQMLMTFLERQQANGQPLLKYVPDIDGLQLLLERAWKQGFDPQGAIQLKHRIYKTRKWLGTIDVYCMMVFLGIRCTILDFDRPSGPNNTHDVMFDWIQSYFAHPNSLGDEGIHITNRPPLYLQHSGHSRTVIGIELLKDGSRNLIMFDPGRRMLRSSATTPTNPESDMDESSLSLSTEEGESDPPHEPWSSVRERHRRSARSVSPRRLLPAPLLRPFRVDAKTIAKNRQYQVLALGEVIDEREQPGGKVRWKSETSYVLSDWERESMKKVTSIPAL